MAEKVFTVSGIHCAGCASRIKTGLGRVDGVRRVSADPDSRQVSVRFDERRVAVDQVAARLAALGYPVEETR